MNISGPINIVRLRKNDKELYLFFDYHADLEKQTQCGNDHSINIIDFFHRLFSDSMAKDPTRMYDFFLEVSPDLLKKEDEVIKSQRTMTHSYIEALEWWCADHFKRRSHPFYSNVRFHYIDIRQYFEEDIDVESIRRGTLEDLCSRSKKCFENLYYVITGLTSSTEHVQKTPDKKLRFLTKIVKDYQDVETKEKITRYIGQTLIPFVRESIIFLEENTPKMLQYVQNTSSDQMYYYVDKSDTSHITCRLKNFVQKVSDYWVDTLVMLMDLYFIRRFIDKSYVRTGLLYSGCYHSINTILILVKHFGYEITHAHYSSLPLADLTKQIRQSVDNDPKFLIPHLWPPKLSQCSSIEGFPLGF